VSAALLYAENQQVLSADQLARLPEVANVHHNAEAPVLISIPQADIAVEVVPGAVHNGIWSIAPVGNYLVSSGLPGEGSNIVLYGHNNRAVFGNLDKVEVGSVVLLVDQEGARHEYEIYNKYSTSPDDDEPLQPGLRETVTIYTCTGFLDSRRLIVQARPL